MPRKAVVALLIVLAATFPFEGVAQLDREKLLKDSGVYGTFAVFKVTEHWWQIDAEGRKTAVREVKSLFQSYEKNLSIDVYLLRGLSETGDLLVRIHSREMALTQNFLVDFMGTVFGHALKHTHTFNGMTKALNYAPSFPDDIKAELKTPAPEGSPYAVVVPIRKDAAWWSLPQETRTAMLKEHTAATVPYLKTVKRKLYHSSGLDDLDFITYFETAKLEDFNNLVIALLKVKENHHNRQFGDPLLLGTVQPLDRILDIFAR